MDSEAPVRTMTEKQKKYLLDLIDDRDFADDAREQMRARIVSNDVTKARASEWIQRLLDKPKLASGRNDRFRVLYEEQVVDGGETKRIGYIHGAGPHRVPRGRYALDTSDSVQHINDTTFFQVWVGVRGGWKVYVQASDEKHEVTQWPHRLSVLKKIAAAPEEAMARYGRELGRCGMCGRTLTNDISREFGIGPVCRTRL